MFNAAKFTNTNFAMPTDSVAVPKLKDFFESDDPVWMVSGLTGEQNAQVLMAQEKNQAIGDLVAAVLTAKGDKRSQALTGLMGMSSDKLPDDIVRRIEILMLGSVEPTCDRDLAIKIGMFFPTVFYTLTNRILELTGEGGHIVGKPTRSTKDQTSK